VSSIVLCVFSVVAMLCLVAQWLYILFAGRRQKWLNGLLKGYVKYRTKMTAYAFLLTEERNPILPED
jgi:Domain of unknown function (DUF4389)